jgi:hypothetical protein
MALVTKGKMGQLAVEFFSVDRLAAGTVCLGEVASLEHELGDDTVENRAFITKSMLSSCKFTEVSGGNGDYIVIELKDNASLRHIADSDVELRSSRGEMRRCSSGELHLRNHLLGNGHSRKR